MNHRCAFKVAIVGCGHVGMTAAYALILKGIPTDLVLYARNRANAEGEKLDFEHSLPFTEGINITATDDFADLAGTDVVIFTAGAAQQPGETRLDLVKKNLAIVEKTIPQIAEHAPHSTIIMVANPVDILTYRAQQLVDWAPGRIFGSGTLLDTARFRFHLSEELNVNPRSIHTYILGEHGDSSFAALSSASIGGQPLLTFPHFSMEKAQDALQKTRQAAYKIIEGKGATYYAIGTALTHIVQAIHRDAKSVVPASVPISDYYGVSDISLSVPVILGRRGAEQILTLSLSDEEQSQLHHSAQVLKEFV